MRCPGLRLPVIVVGIMLLLACTVVRGQPVIEQAHMDQATHMLNEHGLPQLSIPGLEPIDHPALTGLYALVYAGVEGYDSKRSVKPDSKRFAASIEWLKSHLSKDRNGLWVWPYTHDSSYNGVPTRAPWSSAFTQAVGVQALLADWKQTHNKSSLELAIKAAESLFVPLDKGGFLFTSGEDIWFEDIPLPVRNPAHNLSGHMRVLLALGELHDATGDMRYAQWLTKGSDTLLRWLPLYDAGYWLRHDLEPRKQELLFRLANPYGFASPELAIDRIVLRDPVSGQESVLDIGAANDAEGAVRIAGSDWGDAQTVDGRTVRRLKPVMGEREAPGSEGQMVAPYSYFYLTLPSQWQDNLRQQRLELMVEYLDERPGNLEIQMRSIAPDSASFHRLADSELLLSGNQKWRQWKVPVKPRDLGQRVANASGLEQADYLARIANRDSRFDAWHALSRSYANSRSLIAPTQVQPLKKALPVQTPVLPFYSMDSNGVLLMHIKDAHSSEQTGTAVYSLFVVASQAMVGPEMRRRATLLDEARINKKGIKKKPAVDWLLDPRNHVATKGAAIYNFQFLNVYNDVVTQAPWQSSFGQTYVMKALLHALEQELTDKLRGRGLLEQTLKAYSVDVADGGLVHADRQGGWFFEEVPNRTHVLNAQLSALPAIHEVGQYLSTPTGEAVWQKGLASLSEHLALFDTGYWMRYDLNPRKELLFQLDWLKGNVSPLIETISLEAPQFSKVVHLNVATKKAFQGDTRISGPEWSGIQTVDGHQVRGFNNGYLVHPQALSGGTRQNVYVQLQLPVIEFGDDFDIQSHRLLIRYKDVAAGQFAVKIQMINEGKVLAFVPLHNAVITTQGDQQWKTAVIEVRPQDMGWYKGPEYQVFEVDQLEKIAALTKDWFYEQYAQRQRYYLTAQQQGQPVIIEPPVDAALKQPGLWVVDASPTYEGFGFTNALDGDADNDYVAGRENVSPGYVTLGLDKPVSQGTLTLKWESIGNYAGHVRVLAIDTQGGEKQLAIKDIEQGRTTTLELNTDQVFQTLRVEFSRFHGQPRLLLRLIDFKASDRQGAPAAAGTVQDDLYLSATDASNPLRLFRMPVTHNIKDLSDSLVQGVEGEHQQVLAAMNLINGFKVGEASAATPDVTVAEGVGACGSFSNTLLALMAAQGLEGRLVNLHNYPAGDGHTVVEIKLPNKWALYDPTFGAFYTHAGRSTPLSFDEIKSGYASGLDIKVNHSLNRYGFEEYTGRPIFTQARPSGVIGPDRPFLFPLRFSIKGQTSLEKAAFGALWQGADYVGAAYMNQQQEWTLEDLELNEHYFFELVASHVGGDPGPAQNKFVMHAVMEDAAGSEKRMTHTFDFKDGKSQRWKIPFVAHSGTVRIKLVHDYKGPDYRYLSMQRYSLYAAGHQ